MSINQEKRNFVLDGRASRQTCKLSAHLRLYGYPHSVTRVEFPKIRFDQARVDTGEQKAFDIEEKTVGSNKSRVGKRTLVNRAFGRPIIHILDLPNTLAEEVTLRSLERLHHKARPLTSPLSVGVPYP